MKRIAIINQRYGQEVNGGSEYYARLIAQHLCGRYAVEVLTTTALDNDRWSNYYRPGVSELDGIVVRRFRVKRKSKLLFRLIHRKIFEKQAGSATKKQAQTWIERQGPHSADLVRYVAAHRNEYDAYIVVTYLYYPEAASLPLIGDRAIFIPTAHEEPYLDLPIFQSVFRLPKAFVFLTEEEKELVQRRFGVQSIRSDVLGVGVDLPDNVSEAAFRQKYGITDEYVIYVGRIEAGKGCPMLLDYFVRYKERQQGNLKLVLMGKASVPVPDHPDIVNLGFVSEQDKYDGIAGARALIQPSQFESLSIVLLEAMALSVPVIVNAKSAVLRAHCERSGAGFSFDSEEEFDTALRHMLENGASTAQMRLSAKAYVDKNYRWDVIVERFSAMIEYASSPE